MQGIPQKRIKRAAYVEETQIRSRGAGLGNCLASWGRLGDSCKIDNSLVTSKTTVDDLEKAGTCSPFIHLFEAVAECP